MNTDETRILEQQFYDDSQLGLFITEFIKHKQISKSVKIRVHPWPILLVAAQSRWVSAVVSVAGKEFS
ncbi:MAG TPA: hypothetical protein VGA99_03220 [bacterium]